MVNYFVCMGLLLFACAHMRPFSTLSEAARYASYYRESVSPDNANELNPTYTSFFKQNKPSLTHFFTNFFSASERTRPVLDIKKIKKHVEEALCDQKKSNSLQAHVLRLAVKPGDSLLIFSDLQGAFHSLVRGLEELKKQGIINDDLVVQNPSSYIIFNGNALGRTPYNLEILDLIISLMHKNPQRVFYIQSKYENISFWTKYSLYRQLENAGEENLKNQKKLAYLLKDFFQALPFAIYINYKQGAALLRISGYDRDFLEINERNMGNFFSQKSNNIALHPLADKTPSMHDVHVRVLIKNLEGISSFTKNKGLVQLEPRGGARVWAVFSSPTRVHNIVNDFYHDAFAKITFGRDLDDALITLYHRDIRAHEPFAQSRTYSLLSGSEVAIKPSAGKTAPQETITIGSTLDLSKSVASMGRAIYQGITAAVSELNATNKKKLNVIIFDDAYTPAKARENIDYLARKENTHIILLPTGSPTLQASMDLLRSGSMLVLFPVTGAPQFHQANLPGVINLRTSYRNEVYALIPYIVKKYLIKKFAFFYQDDAYGWGAMTAAREILPMLGIKQWVEIPYNRNSTDFKDIVKKINETKPDALGLFSASATTKQMLRELGINALVNTKIFGLSFLADATFKHFADSFGINYAFASPLPNPKTSTLAIAEEYRKVFQDAGLKLDSFSFEGYLGTQLLFDAINKIQDPITPKNLREFFESLKNYEFKGINLTFNTANRELTNDVWLDTGSDEWILVSQAEKSFKNSFNT